MPQGRYASGGSLGAWGLTRESFLHGDRGRGSARVWPWTKTSGIQWCHHNENVLCQEWTYIYSMMTDGAWAGHQGGTSTWEGTPPLIHGQHRLNGASPPRRARPPTCWLSEQRPREMKDVTWICPEVRLSELKLWPQQWSPASLWDWTDGVQVLDPHPVPARWGKGGEGDTFSSHWLCWAALSLPCSELHILWADFFVSADQNPVALTTSHQQLNKTLLPWMPKWPKS